MAADFSQLRQFRPRASRRSCRLEAEGLQLWWHDINYGQSFHKVIEQALAAAPCLEMVLWTREWVRPNGC